MELYKKNILFILVFTLCAFISVPAFVWIVDPFHIYHRDTWLNKDKYYGSAESFNNFMQLKYLNTCDMFDAVLIGNSRTCGFDSIDLKKALPKCKGCIKLTIGGFITPSKHIRFLQKAIKSKKIKNVVFMDPPNITPQSQNRIVLPSLRDSLFRTGSIAVACLHVIDLFNCFPHDKLGLVQLNKVHSYLPENTKEFGKISLKLHLKKRVFTIDDTVPTDIPDNQLLSIIRKYPNITFHLLFPPYNIFSDAPTLDWKATSFFIKNTKELSNVKIYDFHDIPHFYISRNWADAFHFSPVFNKFMAYCIEHSLHTITAKNYDAYKQHVLDVLKSFNPSDYPERPTTFEELVAYEESLHPELKKQKVAVEKP